MNLLVGKGHTSLVINRLYQTDYMLYTSLMYNVITH